VRGRGLIKELHAAEVERVRQQIAGLERELLTTSRSIGARRLAEIGHELRCQKERLRHMEGAKPGVAMPLGSRG
jgi:isopentenyl diphosphate isomerase/L-lactate dehydrogenase-like FMN-dependent dehydrogenase